MLTRDLMDYFICHYVNAPDEVTLALVSPLQTKILVSHQQVIY